MTSAEKIGDINVEYAQRSSGPDLKKFADSDSDSNIFGAETPEK